MKSRMKLIATITSICLAVGMLFVGVYAATSRVDFGITGNILYEVEDTYVEITTKIYKSTTLLSKGQVADTVEELANLSFTQIDSKGLVHLTQNDDTYSSLEDTTGNGEYDGVDELTLTFSTSGSNVAFAYFIVMNVKNLTTNENIYAVMQDEREDCENLFEYDNALQENILKSEDNRNIVIGLTVDKFNTPITSGSFTYGINVGTGDIARSEQMTSKVTVEDGAYYWTENAKGVVVLDPAVDGVTDLLSDDGITGNELVTALIIREGLKNIPNLGLYYNQNLKKLLLPSGIESIGNGGALFAGNYYTLIIDEKSGDKYTSKNASGEELNCVIDKSDTSSYIMLSGSNNVKWELLPQELKKIDCYAFSGFKGVTNIYLLNDITLESNAFQDCINLRSIYIGKDCDSLSMKTNTFGACTGLESIVVDENNAKYTSKINGVETNCIIEKGANNAYTIILGCKNSTLPYGITSIGSEAFDDCTGLESIEIPDSVTSIGSEAFDDCTGLTSIDLGSVLSIGSSAFSSCTGLTSVDLGSVQSIGDHAFYNCTGLESIVIPDSVEIIDSRAFEGCTGLESIVIPDSVSEIGRYAFSSWTEEQSIYFEGTMPENLHSYWNYGCDAKIYLNGVLQN